MRRVTCGDCGKRYDFDRDDFCPRCGSFNPPAASGSTQMERALLSRFETAQPSQAPQQHLSPSHSSRRPVRLPQLRRETPPKPGPVRTQTGLGRLALVIVLLLLLTAAVQPAVGLLSWLAGRLLPASSSNLSLHQIGESFALNDVTVSIDSAVWVPLSEKSSLYREDTQCLALSVWITGGTFREDLWIDTPCICLEDGSQIPLDDDLLVSRQLKTYGIYEVSLDDYLWEDPLMGEFVFFLPAGTSGEVSLLIDEYAPGSLNDPRLRAVHQISIPLPAE